jgi:hypothetical protein
MIPERKLKSLVRSYQELFLQGEKAWLDQLLTCPSLEIVIRRSALAEDKDGKRHPHQYRIPREVLQQVANSLTAKQTEIRNCKDFDDLFQLVKECRVKGFGPLAIYDIAHRMGWWLEIYPEKVYMHCGTTTGARYLGLKTSSESLKVKDFPPAIQILEPSQIEDFLCIFKKNLRS